MDTSLVESWGCCRGSIEWLSRQEDEQAAYNAVPAQWLVEACYRLGFSHIEMKAIARQCAEAMQVFSVSDNKFLCQHSTASSLAARMARGFSGNKSLVISKSYVIEAITEAKAVESYALAIRARCKNVDALVRSKIKFLDFADKWYEHERDLSNRFRGRDENGKPKRLPQTIVGRAVIAPGGEVHNRIGRQRLDRTQKSNG